MGRRQLVDLVGEEAGSAGAGSHACAWVGQVARPLELVVPISLYQSNDSPWNLLRNY